LFKKNGKEGEGEGWGYNLLFSFSAHWGGGGGGGGIDIRFMFQPLQPRHLPVKDVIAPHTQCRLLAQIFLGRLECN